MKLTSTTIPEFIFEAVGRGQKLLLNDVRGLWQAGAFDATGDFDETAWTIEWTVEEVVAECTSLLGDTDWRVTRAVERGVPTPEEWASYREALRTLINDEASGQITWPTKPA